MKTLVSLDEAKALVAMGRPLMFAADERLLAALPRGRWIGGTIPYFMAEEGGLKTREHLFVTALPDFASEAAVTLYQVEKLPRIPADYPDNGVSFIILPAGSQALVEFAQHGGDWPGLFDRPIAGWVAGVDLADLGKASARVFDGVSGESSTNAAVVMHVKLPPGRRASVDIINLFTQGSGDALQFPVGGFQAREVLVNGAPRNFAQYLVEQGVDTKLPLVANYQGAMLNISLQTVDAAAGTVSFYAPVFADVTYRVARPLTVEYAAAFQAELAARAVTPIFACNCILNYLYGGLEGKRTGHLTGPVTFGEVAYMLLNQTLVYVSVS